MKDMESQVFIFMISEYNTIMIHPVDLNIAIKSHNYCNLTLKRYTPRYVTAQSESYKMLYVAHICTD